MRHLSTPSKVKSGVPQGSVLGPLLFLIMIGDIDRGLQYSKATSFADDTRVKKNIQTEGDVSRLQEDLDCLLTWSQHNNIVMNDDKFELMRYGSLHALKQSTEYKVHQQDIVPKDHVYDLGVTMSANGMFSQHTDTITQTSEKLMGWIM